MFARAIHQTAMPFKAFEHHTWQEFFHALRGTFHIPSIEMIGDDLLRLEYMKIMAEVVRNLKQFIMICLTLDGATNVHGKQIINLMACGLMAFFLEHFSYVGRAPKTSTRSSSIASAACCSQFASLHLALSATL